MGALTREQTRQRMFTLFAAVFATCRGRKVASIANSAPKSNGSVSMRMDGWSIGAPGGNRQRPTVPRNASTS